jgi:hypothetical protein
MVTVRQLIADAPAHGDELTRILHEYDGLQDLGLKAHDLDMSLDEVVEKLRECRSNQPDVDHDNPTNAFSRIDNVLVPAWLLLRMIDTIGPRDPPDDYIDPNEYNVLISDVTPEDLPGVVSKALEIEYLSKADTHDWRPVSGKIWGRNRRALVTMPVSFKNRSVHVHFIFDTGAPATYLAPSVLKALDMEQWQLDEVKVNGRRAIVYMTPEYEHHKRDGGDDFTEVCRFKGLNLLGMDFMSRMRATVIIDSIEKIIKIDRST